MILVYKSDFVFIQNIKISLTDLPCEGYQKPEGILSAYKCVSYVQGVGNEWCSAPAHKLGQVTLHIKKGVREIF